MGLKDYLKSGKKDDTQHVQPAAEEKDQQSPPPFNEPMPGTPWGPYGYGSSRTSLTPSTKSRTSAFVDDIRHEVLVNHLFQQQCAARWIGDGAGEREGVLFRKTKGHYLACPPDLVESALADGCVALNLPCAMTVNSRVIKTFLAWSPNAVDVPLKNGLRVQVIPTLEDLPRARKLQFAAFVAQDGLLVVWDDGKQPHRTVSPEDESINPHRCCEPCATSANDRKRAHRCCLEDWRE